MVLGSFLYCSHPSLKIATNSLFTCTHHTPDVRDNAGGKPTRGGARGGKSISLILLRIHIDLDLSETPSLDTADERHALMIVAEGSVLAPSQRRPESRGCRGSGRGRPGDRSQAGNGASGGNRSNGSQGSAQKAGRDDERQQKGLLERADGSGNGQGDWEGSGATGSRQSASNTLATRDAQEQAAVRMQEPLPDQPQGYSLMWYGLQPPMTLHILLTVGGSNQALAFGIHASHFTAQ